MKYCITLILFFSFINFSLLGQPADDAEATAGDTGAAPAASTPAANSASDSAPAAPAAAPQAASMVTAPAPAPAVSTAVESNTLVTAVQAGIDIADAVELGSSNIKKLVVKDGEFSGASISDVVTQFKTRAKVVKVLRGGSDTIDSLVNQIKDQKKDYIVSYADLSVEKLKEYEESAFEPTASLSDRLTELGVKAVVRKANIDAGYSEADADEVAKSLNDIERKNFEVVNLDDLKKSTKKNKDDGKTAKDGHTRNKQAAEYTKKGGDFNTASEMSDDELEYNSGLAADKIKSQKGKTPAEIAAENAAKKKAEEEAAAAQKKADEEAAAAQKKADEDREDAAAVSSTNSELQTAATAVQKEAKYDRLSRNKALRNAVDIAEVLLRPVTISNSNSMDNVAETTVAKLAQSPGYNTELIRILAKYGALGSKGSTLADAVLGTDYQAFDQSISLSSKVQPQTDYYQQFLSDLGARSFGPKRTSNKTHEKAVSVKTSNISLGTGSDITFTNGATVDTSEVLPKGAERRIAVIGAAKDMTIQGNLTFTTTNKTENSAMVLGAADQLFLRSTESSANSADYSDSAAHVHIHNEGANLALGAEKTMKLVNVSISTGGNLAIGSLDELHIGTTSTTDPSKNTLSVGTNNAFTSDPDNIYLYANNLIQVNGLSITGRVDDVYMEAVTINLNNVIFPETAEVTLRSRDGTIGFNQFANPIPGGVNFQNVKHGSTPIDGNGKFNGGPGYWATNKTLPNGTPAIQVKKF